MLRLFGSVTGVMCCYGVVKGREWFCRLFVLSVLLRLFVLFVLFGLFVLLGVVCVVGVLFDIVWVAMWIDGGCLFC